MKQTFKVTKDILRKAADAMEQNGSPTVDCAVARAIRKVYPDACCGIGTACLNVEGWMADPIPLPSEVSTYISTFDRSSYEERLALPEFEFTLEIPV